MDSSNLLLRDFQPRPMVRLKHQGAPERPRFPVIDVHNHLGSALITGGISLNHQARQPADLLPIMDAAGVEAMIDLDGRYGDFLREEISRLQEPYPDRFAVFCGIDYETLATDPNFGETEATRLRESAALGARGLKVWKLLGLRARDHRGNLIAIDDPRLDPLWAAAGELGLPVLIHIADPVAFFEPLDQFNERFEELEAHPDWHFYPTRPTPDPAHPDFPTFDELMDQFANMMLRHPGTDFIGAHLGCAAEDLSWVGQTLDACPNFYVDPSARIAELGRQPYTARDFFITYQDRVLFGTDATPEVDMYRLYYRFLETRDEYFDYSLHPPGGSGRWQIYGLDLPDDVLKKVYADNARRLVLNRSA